MGQIVKRKKKGRPPKSDLARKPHSSPEPARRRSLRRRNVRYEHFIDYDDYEDFEDSADEEDGEEEERIRKEKKLKLVLKIQNQSARGLHSGASSSEESERKEVKKRRVGEESDDVADEEEEEEEEEESENEEKERKSESNINIKGQEQDSAPGTPVRHQHYPNGFPLPDKKKLEIVLDKLQKKDTYGVYAEPVDLEELPDYLDVIDHPMDFATMRKKLGNGSYSTLEQFESDIFLICSNAMQYNSPDTVYHRQARAIQELAKKKLEKLRIGFERTQKESFDRPQKEVKLEQKPKPIFLPKKLVKKSLSRPLQEPIGSDFSSGATLATAEVHNGSAATQAGGSEKPANADGHADGFSLGDNNQEKAEELSSGKGVLSKLGRKLSVLDENRRATYNMPSQPMIRSESIFTTFEGEIKQLVPVGLDAQYSYARSLARFAATLGPVAWKVASQRIEKAVPPDCKFGRGWVGEYEPLPTPVLMLDTRFSKEPILFPKSQNTVDARKRDATSGASVPAKEHPVKVSSSDGKDSLFHSSLIPVKEHPVKVSTSDGKESLFRPSSVSTKEHPVKVCTSDGQKSLFRPSLVSAKEHSVKVSTSDGKESLFRPSSVSAKEHPVKVSTSDGKESLFRSSSVSAKEHPVKVSTSDGKESLFRPSVSAKEHSVKVSTSDGKESLFRPSSVPAKENPFNVSSSDGKEFLFSPSSVPAKEHPANLSTSDGKESLFLRSSAPTSEGKPPLSSPALIKLDAPAVRLYQQQSMPPRNFLEIQTNPPITVEVNLPPTSPPELPAVQFYQQQSLPPRKFLVIQTNPPTVVELNLPPSGYQQDAEAVADKKLPNNSETSTPKPREMSRTVGNIKSAPSSKRMENNGVCSRGLPNGKMVNSSINSRIVSSSSSDSSVPNQMARAAPHFSQGQDQSLTDPVEAMRISAEKAQKQQKSPNQPPADTAQVIPSVPSAGKESSNAAAAAARAWMSIGAGGIGLPTENSTTQKNQISADSLYNPTRQMHPQFPRVQGQLQLPPGVQSHPDKNNFPFQAFMRPVNTGNDGQFQNRPQMVFPQFVAADLSRLQMQSPWQAMVPHSQPKPKREALPPDLNISFQSPGSPVKQSSSVVVDSQQPDLALQL